MNSEVSKYLTVFLFMLIPAWIFSCSGRPEVRPKAAAESMPPEPAVRIARMLLPDNEAGLRLNDKITVSLLPEKEQNLPDSIKVFFDGNAFAVLTSAPWECTVPSSLVRSTGRKPVRAVAYRNGKTQIITRFVVLRSDIEPKIFGYQVVNTYPHDRNAFTQGLFYSNGFLYEGTGQEAGSSLREVDLKTGRVLRQLNLDPSLFGEGITLYNNMIYQVTWTNKVGFVYDRADFKLIKRIYYQTQGWGLTTVDDRIVMSDGSNILYFIEPEMFTVASRIEVYDNEKMVDQLNELEYINGEIWANIWQTDMIARIDPATGKVNSYIDLSPLFPQQKRRKVNADVLNGIAYDSPGSRIFVTGKKWPELYEIRIIE